MSDAQRYKARGVSSGKSEVHDAIRKLDKGLYPMAFCKILPDYFTSDPSYCCMMHADGAGTKSSLAYLYWQLTGDLSVWKGIAQDALVMNTDDLMCAGAVDGFIVSSTIGRNKNKIPGEVIRAIIEGSELFCSKLRDYGVGIILSGGETADLGDLVRTVIVDSTIASRIPRREVIDNSRIRPGDCIVGIASFGQATYEDVYNSGIGSNGLTSARHDVLHKALAQSFPESFDPDIPQDLVYSGTRSLLEPCAETGLTVGQMLLSPTRTYLPLMVKAFKEFRQQIHGMIHCSGGGQTKILHFLGEHHAIKDNLFAPPPVFRMIQQESGTDWGEMYRVFNMGHRLEVIMPEETAGELIAMARELNLEAQKIGRIEYSEKKKLSIISPAETLVYEN